MRDLVLGVSHSLNKDFPQISWNKKLIFSEQDHLSYERKHWLLMVYMGIILPSYVGNYSKPLHGSLLFRGSSDSFSSLKAWTWSLPTSRWCSKRSLSAHTTAPRRSRGSATKGRGDQRWGQMFFRNNFADRTNNTCSFKDSMRLLINMYIYMIQATQDLMYLLYISL